MHSVDNNKYISENGNTYGKYLLIIVILQINVILWLVGKKYGKKLFKML